MISFINLDHEVDVYLFANFVVKRAVATKFAVWFECTDEETAHQHKMEFFDERKRR